MLLFNTIALFAYTPLPLHPLQQGLGRIACPSTPLVRLFHNLLGRAWVFLGSTELSVTERSAALVPPIQQD
eukprot:scaffold2126_cov303-Pavlova_lutheri.AAC.2